MDNKRVHVRYLLKNSSDGVLEYSNGLRKPIRQLYFSKF